MTNINFKSQAICCFKPKLMNLSELNTKFVSNNAVQ